METTGDALVLGSMTFLLGVVVTAAINSLMRRMEKNDSDVRRHQALAYAHVVRTTEFVASEALFRGTFTAFPDHDLPADATFRSVHRNAIEFEQFLENSTSDERLRLVADIKYATGLISAYLDDFHLSAEKLADLPRTAIFAYNQFQLDARRIASELQLCCERLEGDEPTISAEVICRAISAFNANADSARKLRDELIPLANLSEADSNDLYSDCSNRLKQMMAEIVGHTSAIQSARKSIADIQAAHVPVNLNQSTNRQSYSAVDFYRSSARE